MSTIDSAVASFNSGFNCSQAILSTYAPAMGLDTQTALRIAAGFGGGMGRMAGVCGAVTGAFMVLGLKYGPVRPDDKEAKQRTYELVRQFSQLFEARNGAIMCKKLLGCDISTPEGQAVAADNKLFATICPKLVCDAAEIVQQLLAEPMRQP